MSTHTPHPKRPRTGQPCEHCGAPTAGQRWPSDEPHRFCSPRCAIGWRLERGWRPTVPTGPRGEQVGRVELTCEWCGKTWRERERHPSALRGAAGALVFCSRSCVHTARKRNGADNVSGSAFDRLLPHFADYREESWTVSYDDELEPGREVARIAEDHVVWAAPPWGPARAPDALAAFGAYLEHWAEAHPEKVRGARGTVDSSAAARNSDAVLRLDGATRRLAQRRSARRFERERYADVLARRLRWQVRRSADLAVAALAADLEAVRVARARRAVRRAPGRTEYRLADLVVARGAARANSED